MPPYGIQGSFGPTIANLMHTYNTAPPTDELTRAQNELNQVKDIMVHNVEQILNRGERIELLVDKTDVMAGRATAFRRGARTVRRQMWWRDQKMVALCIVVGLVSYLFLTPDPSNVCFYRTQLTYPFVDVALDPSRPVLWRNSEPVPVLEFDPWCYSRGLTTSFVLSAYCLS